MTRQYVINGECLARVKGNKNAFGTAVIQDLGLSTSKVEIVPTFKHKDIIIDDFGPDIPADTMWMLCDVRIRMTLVNFDVTVLQNCINSSMANSQNGTLTGAGTLMGQGVAGFTAGTTNSPYIGNNWYISLSLTSPVLQQPWTFPSAYLSENPIEIPLGTEKELVVLNWRAIPYVTLPSNGEVLSKNAILWTRTIPLT